LRNFPEESTQARENVPDVRVAPPLARDLTLPHRERCCMSQSLSENVAAGVPPAVEVGILPSGKTIRLAETPDFAGLIARRRCFRRAGRTGFTSAKMAASNILKYARKHPQSPNRRRTCRAEAEGEGGG